MCPPGQPVLHAPRDDFHFMRVFLTPRCTAPVPHVGTSRLPVSPGRARAASEAGGRARGNCRNHHEPGLPGAPKTSPLSGVPECKHQRVVKTKLKILVD